MPLSLFRIVFRSLQSIRKMYPFVGCRGLLLGWIPFLLSFADVVHGLQQVVLTDSPGCDWDLAKEPTKNSTHNLVFDTVGSFLQHWPNTRYRNGEQMRPIPTATI